MGNLKGVCIAPEPLFTFRRYNVLLEPEWLKDVLGVAVSPRELKEFRRVDSIRAMSPLYDLATKAAALQI